MAGIGDAFGSGETAFLLWALAIAWTLMSAAISGGNPSSEIALLIAVGVAWLLGRLSGHVARWVVPALVLAAALSLVVASPGNVFGRGALQGAFHYANAKGSFFAIASLAGLGVATATRSKAVRLASIAAAVVCVAVPFAIGSFAAGILAAVLGPAALVAAVTGRTRLFVLTLGAFAMVVLLATILLGSLFRPAAERQVGLESAADSFLSERRPALWHDALSLMATHAVFGVGPNRFQVTSPVALSDRDARWAHNEFLQQGAEQGVPGFLLLVLGFGWGFARLAIARPGRLTALAAAALATLAIHGSIDYIMHFPAIPIGVAALVGNAAAAIRRPKRISPLVRVQGNGHAGHLVHP